MSAAKIKRLKTTPVRASVVGDAIDHACRAPLLVLFVFAAAWLVVGAVLGLLASMKFHSPDFAANVSWLTYGRSRPAANMCVVYGFLVQAFLGIALWIFSRLGAAGPAATPLSVSGALVLNVATVLGIVGILAGDATGFEWFEMPGYAAGPYIVGYIAVALAAALTFHERRTGELYVSHWFLLAALLWFPWIFMTGLLLLSFFPVRGVTQAIIAWWYAGNLRAAWFWLAGLGCVYYFLPRLTGRQLASRYLALLSFWLLLFFASWVGIPSTAPVPAWMPTASRLGSILCLALLVTLYLNYQPLGKREARNKPVAFETRFFTAAYVLLLVLIALEVATAFVPVERRISFTWFVPAEHLLAFAGAGALIVFGAAYHILPRIIGEAWQKTSLVRLQYWLTMAGLVLWLLPLMLGGIAEGAKLNNPDVPMLQIASSSRHFIRISTMGELLYLAGAFLFLFNISAFALGFYRRRLLSYKDEVLRDMRVVEGVRA